MSRDITLYLNDALYNAGLLGFYEVCRHFNLPINVNENTLNFQSDIFKNFTSAFLDKLIYDFRNDTIYYEILHRFHLISHENCEGKALDEHLKYILEKLSRASYKAAYEIIKNRGEIYNFEDSIKSIKSEKESTKKLELLAKLMSMIKIYEDLFILKDIAYTKIQPFWTNAAFLLKTANKDEFSKSYEKSFTARALNFKPSEEKKAKINCCQCNTPLTATDANAMSWINDVGIDMNRKTSYYWNFNPDTYLCPVCNLVYSCIPLGFTVKGSDGIFINQNKSILTLCNINGEKSFKETKNRSDIYWKVLQQFIADGEQQNSIQELQNIQVIRRSNNQYHYNILSKEKLQIIKDCEKAFHNIAGKFITINGETKSLYREALNHVLYGTSLYSLIHPILHTSAELGNRAPHIFSLLQIQASTFFKGDATMNNRHNYSIAKQGDALRRIMTSDERNSKKIRTLSYHLLNCLKVRNKEKFANILLRQYISLNLPAPNCITQLLGPEEQFLILGHSFVAGLNDCLNSDNKDKGET